MSLCVKILLPHKIFKDITGIENVTLETTEGSFGMLPHRLDCVAILVPGIFAYEDAGHNKKYLALDEGMLVKIGNQITISVRNAVGEAPLGEIKKAVEQEFQTLSASEKDRRVAMMKLESGFVRQFEKLRKE